MSQEEAVTAFRDLINQYKRPFLEKTLEKEEYSQDTAKLNGILRDFDELYTVLYYALQPGAPVTYKLEKITEATKKMILDSFQRKGGFSALKEHPDWKSTFLYYLKTDLKDYPFTMNTGQINAFVNDKVPTEQRAIIPNEE